MAQIAEAATNTSPVSSWVRQYPPLALLVVAILIAVLVLPSALNLPQANPSTVLEYAPVPPDDDTPPPNDGSISALGLGSSSGLTTGAPPTEKPKIDPKKDGGKGKKAVTKRCVGKPLRQTEDPNSPPCVPFFEGDNGGATWQGVTEDEITVLVYSSAYTTIPDNRERRNESTPAAGSYCDVDGTPNTDRNCLEDNASIEDHAVVRVTRAFSRYFNDRFQTYGRKVHFWVYFSGADTPAERKADASGNYDRLKPFAVLDNAFFGGHNDAYADAVTRRRVSLYGSFASFANSFYRDSAPYIWSFWPDVEHGSDLFVSYICSKVAPYPVAHSGNPEDQGKPRKIAFLYTKDDDFKGLQYFAEFSKLRLEQCPNGAKLDVVVEATYSRNQYQIDSHPDAVTEARDNIAKMEGAGATTIIWLGGYETQHSAAARKANWFPEWIVSGDLLNDTIDNGRAQDQDVWKHAWVVTNLIREDRTADSPARQAYREAEPSGNSNDEEDALNLYRTFFTLFKAIQVAGPELTPQSVDQGQHAIPRQASYDPRVAACFYDPADFTCVKDAMETWWDPEAPDPEGRANAVGCYRMVRNGKRYLAGTWEGTDQDVFADRSNLCNTSFAPAFLGTPAD